jgi:hypothetical protein
VIWITSHERWREGGRQFSRYALRSTVGRGVQVFDPGFLWNACSCGDAAAGSGRSMEERRSFATANDTPPCRDETASRMGHSAVRRVYMSGLQPSGCGAGEGGWRGLS